METLIQKGVMLGLKYGKKTRHQIEAIIQKAEAEVKLEITTTDEIKVKALKRLYFHLKVKNRSTRSKTEDNREKYDQKKRNIFPKDRITLEKFETILITTNGSNRNVRLAEQEHNEVHIIPETQFSQNNEGKDVQVSTEWNNFFFHWSGCSTWKRQSKINLSSKTLNLSGYSLSKNQKTF